MSPARIPSQYYERWFAAMVPDYQGDVNCVLEFAGAIDERRMTQAFLCALAAEPMWSYRFVTHWWTPYWSFIPREDRAALVTVAACASSEERFAAWERILASGVDAAARVMILRTPQNDHVCLRVDHRLADANAARHLLQSIAEHYQRQDEVPATDGPVIRRTALALLRPLANLRTRWKLFQELLVFVKRSGTARGFTLPTSTEDDPYVSPQFLHYPEGAASALTARAMRDRATAAMVIIAVTYIALRDVLTFTEGVRIPINLPVNLRRYLPAAEQAAPASMLTGQVSVWIDPQHAADVPAIVEQVRTQLAAQRGPHFGLSQSALSLDLPLLRQYLHWNPFANTKRNFRRMNEAADKAPMVLISDLGEFGKPEEAWDGVSIENGYSTQGTWRQPAIMIGMSTCGTRLTLAVGSGPGSFVRRFAERIDFHLSRYVGWAPLCPPTAS
ncbi:MAG: hypothetical protein Q8K78_08290 [Planctomycetaceae bacterium]|nr:hypothetical protein [Planctomycetaceae bacterium]